MNICLLHMIYVSPPKMSRARAVQWVR